MTQQRNYLLAGIFMFIIFSLLACQTPAGRSAGGVVDDATITTKVKAKLFDDDIVKGLAIAVKTFNGEVTLTGAVENQIQLQRASDLAYSVQGVGKVNNLLKIKEQ
jgi:hyperosmotically inducible periplasmic protein